MEICNIYRICYGCIKVECWRSKDRRSYLNGVKRVERLWLKMISEILFLEVLLNGIGIIYLFILLIGKYC